MIIYYEQEIRQEKDSYMIPITTDWEGVEDGKVQVILDDICVIFPPSIGDATGEVLVLKFVEAMIESGIVDSGDVQKALEHLV